MLDRIIGWIFALALSAALVLGTAFLHPEWLPADVHAYLLARQLAKPLPPEAPAAPPPGAGQAPVAQGQGGQAQPQGQNRPAGAAAGSAQGGARPIAVEAAKVQIGPVKATLTAVGSLTADERTDITAEVEGRVTEVGFTEGGEVKAGDVMFRLDDQSARAAVAQTSADLGLAEANSSRAEALSAQKFATDKTRDESRFALDKARANADIARVNLEKTVLRAPFAGHMGLRKVSPGSYVTRGQVLATLVKDDIIKVDFRLAETELGTVAVGNRIAVEIDALPGKPFAGDVYAIDPQIDVNGRAILLRARVSNTDGTLRPGLFARVELTTAERPNALIVPESALVPQGRDRSVYVVRDGKAVAIKVTTGLRMPGRVEIVEGLMPEDIVISSGQQRLRPGVAVDVVGPGTGG